MVKNKKKTMFKILTTATVLGITPLAYMQNVSAKEDTVVDEEQSDVATITVDETETNNKVRATGDIPLTATYFPDEYFRKWLSDKYDTNKDNYLSSTEIAAVKTIFVNDTSISSYIESLDGIEYFTSLTTLEVSLATSLKSLNLSGNTTIKTVTLTWDGTNRLALETLDLSNCTNLEKLGLGGSNVTDINLSGCKSLAYVGINEANSGLKSLNLKNVSSLTNLDVSGLSLETLNVTGCTSLETLRVNDNNLTTLDVTTCTSLIYIYAYGNNLTTVKLGNIDTLSLYNNPNLTSLDISGVTNLTVLLLSNTGLTSLDLSALTSLTGLNINGTAIAYVTLPASFNGTFNANSMLNIDLDVEAGYDENKGYYIDLAAIFPGMDMSKISNVSYGYTFEKSTGRLYGVTEGSYITYTYRASNYVTLEQTLYINTLTLPVPEGIAIIEANFPDATFRSYLSSNFDTDKNGYLSSSEIAKITSIDISNESNIKNLTGISYFTSLTSLNASGTGITSLDVSGNTALTYLNVSNTSLNR